MSPDELTPLEQVGWCAAVMRDGNTFHFMIEEYDALDAAFDQGKPFFVGTGRFGQRQRVRLKDCESVACWTPDALAAKATDAPDGIERDRRHRAPWE
jgi:hypothetical protein